MKRTFLLIVLSVLLIMLLGACTGETQQPADEGGSEAAAPTAAAEDEAPPEEEAAMELECTDEIGCVEIAPDEAILLASSLVISGPNTELGLDSQHGVEIALDFRGEVLGHAVELQPEDDGCNAEGGQTSATKIVSNPQIVAMVGTSCSGAGVPAAEIISQNGFVMVSPSNTSPGLTDPEQAWLPGYLRTAHNDTVQGRAMAEFASMSWVSPKRRPFMMRSLHRRVRPAFLPTPL